MALSGAGEMVCPSSGEVPAAPPEAISTFCAKRSVPPERGCAALVPAGAALVPAGAAAGLPGAAVGDTAAGEVGAHAAATLRPAPNASIRTTSRRLIG